MQQSTTPMHFVDDFDDEEGSDVFITSLSSLEDFNAEMDRLRADRRNNSEEDLLNDHDMWRFRRYVRFL
jgi:hypothetical protein